MFGNRPGSTHVLYLTSIFVFLILASSLLELFSNKKKSASRELTNNKFVNLPGIYVLISVLSLGVFYCQEVLSILYSIFMSGQGLSQKLEYLVRFIFYILTQEENSIYYPLSSVIQTLLAYLVYKKVRSSITNNHITAQSYLIVFTLGLLTTLGVGFYNYYYPGILNTLRPIDPLVNPGGVEFRLQSFFGHSGWFAEYVTLVVPSILVLLLLKLSFKFRAFLIVFILLISEFALILSYQRGAWLSYPITLFVIWSAIYCFYIFEKNKFDNSNKITFLTVLKSSFVKILFSIPITVILSLSLIWAVSKFELVEGRSFHGLWSYSDRFKQISNTSDRTKFFNAGLKLGMLHPILGAGSESFSLQYEKEFYKETGRYYKEIDLPLHGSAHNVFMQTFSGKGVLGLFSLLLILLSCIKAGYRAINNPNISRDKLIICLFSFCFSCSFLIYGQVQEVFYVQSLQYLFFIFLGISLASSPEYFKLEFLEKNKSFIYPVIFLLFIVHNVLEYPNGTLDKISGCYSNEIDTTTGSSFLWCSPRASIINPASELMLEVPISNKEQVSFLVKGTDNSGNEILKESFKIKAGEKRKLENLTASNLEITTDSAFYANGDKRALSFIVR